MQIKASQATLNIDPMKTKKTLASAQEQTQEALLEIRRSVAALRAFPDETKPFPERIERLLKTSFPESIRYHYQVLGDARALAPEVELTLYRVTQEAVNNILKHSQASQVNVELDYATSPGDVFFRIQDNGVGSDEIGGGFGLIGLQERIDLIGGTFNIETAKEKGFSIQVGVQG
jgi:signal transduction histidine kinase